MGQGKQQYQNRDSQVRCLHCGSWKHTNTNIISLWLKANRFFSYCLMSLLKNSSWVSSTLQFVSFRKESAGIRSMQQYRHLSPIANSNNVTTLLFALEQKIKYDFDKLQSYKLSFFHLSKSWNYFEALHSIIIIILNPNPQTHFTKAITDWKNILKIRWFCLFVSVMAYIFISYCNC